MLYGTDKSKYDNDHAHSSQLYVWKTISESKKLMIIGIQSEGKGEILITRFQRFQFAEKVNL